MALIQSLQIRGIRSFSPENNETIYFNTPVTLFLGQNGCGKTTIIESIRFALTSELPGGSNSGQGFLNDPKMSNKSSTKGSVKIKFLDCQGHQITVSKFMSVTAKSGGGLTFKKMSVNVRRRDKDDPGNPQDISGRCIDIDSYCCTALNVSKSILNNVIFCHQENSSWPLDEPKKLKEKFDEIFDAVRYIRCVETIRKHIKDKQSSILTMKQKVENAKSIKDEVERKRARCDERKEKLEEIKDKIKDKENEVEPKESRMKEILDLEVSLGSLQRKLTGKEAEKKGLIEQQNTVRSHISYEFQGSDEELQEKINSFQNEQADEENNIRDLENRKKEVFAKCIEIGGNVQKVQVKIGELKEEQKQHNKRKEEANDLIEKAKVKFEIDHSTDFSNTTSVIQELREALNQSEKSYEELVKQKDQEEKDVQNTIDEVREKFASTKQDTTSKNNLISECQIKIRDINFKLEELDTSDSQLRVLGDNIKKLQNTLTTLQNSFNENDKLRDIEELKEKIQEKEKYWEKLEREYKILQKNYVNEQKLESEKSGVIEKQGDINRIKTKHSQNFKDLFGDDVPERNLKKSVLEIQAREDKRLKKLTENVNKLQKNVTTLEASIRHQKEKIESAQRDLQTNKRKLAEVCSGRPFNDVLNDCYVKKEKLQKDKGQYSSAKIMYDAFISKFERDSPCCPVCQTDFSARKSAIKDIVQSLRNKIEAIPAKLVKIERDLKAEEDLYNRLQQLKSVNDDIEVLSNVKIPLLQEALEEMEKDHENASLELVSVKADLVTPQQLIDVCRQVISDVPLLDQYLMDVSKANANISQLEALIVQVPSNRSRQETEAEIDSVKAELSNLKNHYESNKTMLDSHKDRCQRLQSDIQREIQRQIDMQKLVQEKPLLEIQKEEYTEKLNRLREEVETLNETLNSLSRELIKVTDTKKTVVQANRRLREDEWNRIMSNKTLVNEIQKLQDKIDQYVRNNNDNKLVNAVAELAELKTKEEKLEEAKNKISEAISNKKQNLAKQQSNFRALIDNQTLREKQKLAAELTSEIDDLKKHIGDYNYKSLYEEKQRLQRSIDAISRDISSMTGQRQEIVRQISEIEDDLERPQNKNAYNNFKKQYYALRVSELAVHDLSVYVTVLERSVLQFHKERMVQINRTIRELWRNIYRGNDIDYVEIQTDESIGSNTKKRTYNYKVVQVKNGVELEMRGRCSAGQKVLACLVIRMALAETFSAHCGILALDEPTTNLDRENIVSLSDALARIIAAREREKNFQLFIITHDEEFLNTLTRVQSLDSYWRVCRNEEGFSTVQRQLL